MPKPRKPHLHKEVTRHGKVVWYFRRGHEKRIRIPGEYDSPSFLAAYDAALAGRAKASSRSARAGKGTFKWLVDQYRATSAEWHA